MTTPQLRMLAKCKEVFARAMELYGTDMSKVAIRFDLKGRVGGIAGAKGFPRQYYMRFNADMVQRDTDEMVNEVVSHEAAHIVCYMKPALGRNHDFGWARVCRQLGGTGNRTHDMDVVYGHGTTYEYTTDRGHKVRLNDRRHEIVQQGRTLTYRKGLGTVSQQCAYSIVGARGKSFATPKVVIAAPTKEAPVSTFVPAVRPTLAVFTPPVRIAAPVAGQSKAATSRAIMLAGHRAGESFETIIAKMIAANGYTRQLAIGTYKANAPKVGITL